MAIRRAVKAWIIKEANQLADGKQILENISDIPFGIIVEKLSNCDQGIYFERRLPGNNDSLPSRIYEHLTRKEKIAKLVPYKKDGFTTVLLVKAIL